MEERKDTPKLFFIRHWKERQSARDKLDRSSSSLRSIMGETRVHSLEMLMIAVDSLEIFQLRITNLNVLKEKND